MRALVVTVVYHPEDARISDTERRHELGKAGHRIAQDRYNWGTHAASFVAEVERVALPAPAAG